MVHISSCVSGPNLMEFTEKMELSAHYDLDALTSVVDYRLVDFQKINMVSVNVLMSSPSFLGN